ncbi:MAG: hypothetical protein KJO44_02210, partial [Gemmatimonadetes bacterium]|nr:hypothetical protein [Gemmatimonadota bacterium]
LAVFAMGTTLLPPPLAHSQEALLASKSIEVEAVSGMKSESTASLLSLAGTVVPMALGMALMNSGDGGAGSGLGLALFSYGMYFGPATGYWYAGSAGAAWKGIGMRLGISLVATAATAAVCSGGGCEMFRDDSAMPGVAVVGLLALGATAYSLIHDIAGADGEVRRHNAEVAARHRESRLSFVPVVTPRDGGTLGVVATMRF